MWRSEAGAAQDGLTLASFLLIFIILPVDSADAPALAAAAAVVAAAAAELPFGAALGALLGVVPLVLPRRPEGAGAYMGSFPDGI